MSSTLEGVLCTFTDVTPISILQACFTFVTRVSSGTCNTIVAILFPCVYGCKYTHFFRIHLRLFDLCEIFVDLRFSEPLRRIKESDGRFFLISTQDKRFEIHNSSELSGGILKTEMTDTK